MCASEPSDIRSWWLIEAWGVNDRGGGCIGGIENWMAGSTRSGSKCIGKGTLKCDGIEDDGAMLDDNMLAATAAAATGDEREIVIDSALSGDDLEEIIPFWDNLWRLDIDIGELK